MLLLRYLPILNDQSEVECSLIPISVHAWLSKAPSKALVDIPDPSIHVHGNHANPAVIPIPITPYNSFSVHFILLLSIRDPIYSHCHLIILHHHLHISVLSHQPSYPFSLSKPNHTHKPISLSVSLLTIVLWSPQSTYLMS